MPILTFLNKSKSIFSNSKNGTPSQRIRVIGVTGSRGKTTTSEMLYHFLKGSGAHVGYLSSLGYTTNMTDVHNDLTADTIQPRDLNDLLSEMISNGLSYAVVEITPGNLKNKIYDDLIIDSAIITNLRGDNFSEFDSFGELLNTKLKFINQIRDRGLLILNDEEPDTVDWLRSNEDAIEQDIYIYPVNLSDINIDNVSLESGMNITWDGRPLSVNSPMHYNLLNTLQAFKMAESYKPDPKMHLSTKTYEMPKGRAEIVNQEPVKVIIDYAYTPVMLEESLSEISKLKNPSARIITVFGCAGKRDYERRKMGLVSMKYSYMSVLTSEDPKNEKVYDINSQIYGFTESQGGVLVERFSSAEEYQLSKKDNLLLRVQRVKANGDHPFIAFDADDYTSRLDAIHFAINFANPGDIVYITGKGHETTLAFDGIEYEWSDHEAVNVALSKQFQTV